jgi:hypothetical protein
MCRALAEKVPLNTNEKNHRSILENIAYHAMLERGLLPDFSPEVLAELDRLQLVNPSKWKQITGSGTIQDMRNLLWASIDNDDSHDLDQLMGKSNKHRTNSSITIFIQE